MKILIDEGSIIPHYPWYLPAYDEFRLSYETAHIVCYPIGIHLIVRIVRRIFHWYMWNIDNGLKRLTKYDDLDFANSRIEYLTAENEKLQIKIMNAITERKL